MGHGRNNGLFTPAGHEQHTPLKLDPSQDSGGHAEPWGLLWSRFWEDGSKGHTQQPWEKQRGLLGHKQMAGPASGLGRSKRLRAVGRTAGVSDLAHTQKAWF